MRTKLMLLTLLALASLARAEEPETQARLRVSGELERSHLSGGLASWQQSTVRIGRHVGAREVQELGLTQLRRFGEDDTEAALLASQPLAANVTATLEVGFSPTHRTVARHKLSGAVQYGFAPGWLLHTGARLARYNEGTAHTGTLALESYFRQFSAMLVWQPTRSFGRVGTGWQTRLSYHYGDRSSVTFMMADGEEPSPGTAGGIDLSRVRSAAVFGRHRLSGPWSLSYGAHLVRHEGAYRRRGATVGAAYEF